LTQPQLVGVLEQSLRALAHVHARGVLNLDLRPEDVLVTTDGRVKLADPGITKAYRTVREGGSEHTANDPSIDLHALGTTAYELVVGWPPFEDISPVTILRRYRIDPGLAAWIGRLLEAAPWTARDALAELDAIAVAALGPAWADEARLPPLRTEFLPNQPDVAAPPPTQPLRVRLRDAAAAGVVPATAPAAAPSAAVPPPEYWHEPEPPPEPLPPTPEPASDVFADTSGQAPSPAPPRRSPARLWPWLVAPLFVLGAAAVAAKWVLGLLADPGAPGADDADVVDCTVFAPPSAALGHRFLVQVFVHLPGEADDAKAIASELDTDARRRAFRSLQAPVHVGSRLDFELRLDGALVPDSQASLVWRRRTEAVQFEVSLPVSMPVGTAIGTVSISLDSVPLGHVKFKLEIEPHGADRESEPQGEDVHRYRYAFISYSSKDRDEVLRRVQLLPLVGIDYFQDVLSLEPGDRWSQRIELGIDRCDLFLLFWSSDAKRSEWVRREVRYALTRKGGDDLLPPEIRPVVVEGPPIVEPWEELADLHFNDRHLYFIRAEARRRACANCGGPIDPEAQFCGQCGTYLGWQRED
jgi:hypothetical protein